MKKGGECMQMIIYRRQRGILRVLLVLTFLAIFFVPQVSRAQNLPLSKAEIAGEDGSIWERISEPGFGDRENLAIVAMCAYQGRLYASTRNET